MGRSCVQGWSQSCPRADRCEDRSRVRMPHSSFNARGGSLSCSNMLALVPDGEPRSRIVGPKLLYMDERIVTIDLVISKLVRCAFSALRPDRPLSVVSLTLFAVEKAIPKNELYHRWYGSSSRRCTQSERMALGLLGTNVDNLAHGKVR
jgi:hypothetical protein